MTQPLTLAFLYSRIKVLVREVVLLRRENAKLWGIVEALDPDTYQLDIDGTLICIFTCAGTPFVGKNEARFCNLIRLNDSYGRPYYHTPTCPAVKTFLLQESRSSKKSVA